VTGAWRYGAALLLLAATIPIESCAPIRRGPAGASPITPAAADPPAETVAGPAAPPAEATPSVAPDLFVSSVRPVLSRRCAPCHEPGGKMYGRLPFDDPQTITSHSEGISRRLKGEDLEALKKWLASLPAKEKT
jgi:hypothetical protein